MYIFVKIATLFFNRTIVLLSILLFSTFVYGQEICNNGIDDDGNGLIDLNDTSGCHCLAPVPSLIPNPSFETMACCPSTYSQLSCAQGWIQASSATSDYMNTCGIVFPAATAAGLVPFPDGNGMAGLISSIGYQEYIGACLNSPMLADSTYSLQMNIASTPINGTGGVCNGGTITYEPSDIVLYGSTNCADIPFSGSACPPSNWQILGTTLYSPVNTWGTITITFTPTVNIKAIIFGSPCTLPSTYTQSPCYPYFYFDNLLLNKSSLLPAPITQSGSWCASNQKLTGTSVTNASYQWYLAGIAIVGQTNLTLDVSGNNLPVGNYTLVTTVGSVCSRSVSTVTKSVATPPTIFPSGPFCKSDLPTFLNANIANGIWMGTGITDSIAGEFDPSRAIVGNNIIVYKITGSSAKCPRTDTTTIVVNSAPSSNAGNDLTMCSGGLNSIGVPPTIGYAYSWSPTTDLSDPFVSNPNVMTINNNTVALVTSYTLQTTSFATGCSSNDTVTVTVNPRPRITPAGPFCKYAPILTFTASIPGGVWAGTGIINASTGTFSPIVAAIGNDTITYLASGVCPDADTAIIVVKPPPISNAGPDITLCSGTSGIIGDTAITGTNYSWTPTTALSNSTISNPSVTITNAGSGPIISTYIVTTSAGGCSSTDTVKVSVTLLPMVDAGPAQTICATSNVTLAGMIGASATSGTWSGGTGTYLPDNTTLNAVYTPSATEINVGAVKLILTTNDPTGPCTRATDSVTITITPQATVNAGPDDTICAGGTYNLNGTFSGAATSGIWSGGLGTYNPDNTTANTVYTPTPNEAVAGYAKLIFTTDDPIGPCASVSDTMKITINPLPTANAGQSQSVCAGTAITLNGSIGGATSALWSGGTGVFSPGNSALNTVYTPSPSEFAADSIQLTLTTNNPISSPCLSSSSDVTFYFYQNPIVNFMSNDSSGCGMRCINFTDLTTIGGSEHITSWDWNFGDNSPDSITQNPSHCYSQAGIYTVSLKTTSGHDCFSTFSILHMIQIFALPVAAFEATPNPATVLDPNITLHNQSSSDADYWFWNFGDGDTLTQYAPNNAIHIYPNDSVGEYIASLIVQNANGCYDTVAHEIIIGPEFSFYIPNSFTPNNDGKNDFFRGEGVGIEKYELTIFDRWGNLAFYTNDLNKGWDGKVNNGDQTSQQDVYSWKVQITDVFRKKHNYIGSVTIIK